MTLPKTTKSPNGVSANQSAGTPFPIGPEASAAALEVLEFARVLEQVAGHAAGPAGAARIRARLPSGDRAWIEGELAPVAELLELMAQGEAPDALARSEEHTSELQS